MSEPQGGETTSGYSPFQARPRYTPNDGPEGIRHFPAGALLEMRVLSCEDVLLSGWAGLARPHSSADNLIGVLLPGDRIGPVLDGHLCCAVALTPVALAPDADNGDWPRELTITYELEEADGATKLYLRHEGIPEDAHDDCVDGWNQSFDKIDKNIK